MTPDPWSPTLRQMNVQNRVWEIVAAQRPRLSPTDTVEDVLLRVRQDGVPPYDALLAVEMLLNVPFDEVKEAMSQMDAWQSFRVSEETLDAAEAAAGELADPAG
jgi:nicotinamide mononucleotide adenylyltransferase